MLASFEIRDMRSAITFAFVVICAVLMVTLLLIIIAHWSLLSAHPISDDVQPSFPQASDVVLSTWKSTSGDGSVTSGLA